MDCIIEQWQLIISYNKNNTNTVNTNKIAMSVLFISGKKKKETKREKKMCHFL